VQAEVVRQAIVSLGRVAQCPKVGCFFNVVYKGSLPYSRQLLQHGLYASISYTSLSAVCITHSLAESEPVVSCLLQINLFQQICLEVC